jgi:alpha-ketoglutarate-dependent taurine dioxygenase
MNPELHDGWLRVHFHGRGHADFHYRWLRHNCDRDLHPKTRERMLCSSELPDDLRATSASVIDETLVVQWEQGGRESRYPLGWLEEHAYARDRVEQRIPSEVACVSIDDYGAPLAQRVERALAKLRAHGAAVVRRNPAIATPAEDETETLIEAFSAAGLRVIGTHFGRIEDLRTDNVTNANTDQLGYTDAPIELHTDQPFLEAPPRMQLLQCIRPAETGGDSYLVDALSAASHLRSIDAAAYELLATTPVRFHRKQQGFEKILDAPLLSGDHDAFQVRWSYFTLAPYRLPFERMEAWYRAHDRFARLVRDERNQYRFALAAGDFVLYDNYRMMHARTSFRGARWLRGIYFDR